MHVCVCVGYLMCRLSDSPSASPRRRSRARRLALAGLAHRVFAQTPVGQSQATTNSAEQQPVAVKTVGRAAVTMAVRTRDAPRNQQTPYARAGRRPLSSRPSSSTDAAQRTARPASASLASRPSEVQSEGDDNAHAAPPPPPQRAGPLLVPSTPLAPKHQHVDGAARLPVTHAARPALSALQIRDQPRAQARLPPPSSGKTFHCLCHSSFCEYLTDCCRRPVSAHPMHRRPTRLLDGGSVYVRRAAPKRRSAIADPLDSDLSRWWSPLISGSFVPGLLDL